MPVIDGRVPAAGDSMDKLRTIVVDDHRAFRTLAGALLEDHPAIEVIAFGESGEEAVELCERHKPDLLLVDISMPRMGGLQASRLIKAQDEPPHIVIVSNFDDAGHREHAAASGADNFIGKAEFMEGVDQVVAQLQALRGAS
jgi:DNA-binding NarL/FixJ family response regulator